MSFIPMKNWYMMRESQPGRAGLASWSCPSNIAIVKYWGKRSPQLPMNPSISLGLEKARTHTQMAYEKREGLSAPVIDFRFEGAPAPAFESRIAAYIHGLLDRLPSLGSCHLSIQSSNSFPHSSGIASSASSMAALALCLLEADAALRGKESFSMREASQLARLGSGSACRSIYPGFVLWGESEAWPQSSNEFALPLTEVHADFAQIRDAILVVEAGQKKVSSSAGHQLMEGHPYAAARKQQAAENAVRLKGILQSGDWPAFIELMEEEALALHAMMLSSRPGYLLFKAGSLAIMELIRHFRKESGLQLGFTLDAGANVHLLYRGEEEGPVTSFIERALLLHCEEGQVIYDQLGQGPQQVKA